MSERKTRIRKKKPKGKRKNKMHLIYHLSKVFFLRIPIDRLINFHIYFCSDVVLGSTCDIMNANLDGYPPTVAICDKGTVYYYVRNACT